MKLRLLGTTKDVLAHKIAKFIDYWGGGGAQS